jgi:hypothetical protein
MDNTDSRNLRHNEGLFMLGLPNTTLIVVKALTRKTGKSMAQIIGIALQSLAEKVLKKEDLVQLAKDIKDAGIYSD